MQTSIYSMDRQEGPTAVYTAWIDRKVLLHSTGNYTQYPVINRNGEEYEKEYVYR